MEGGGVLPASQFPPGFRFHPTDQELIIHYLRKKLISSLPPSSSIIADIDLYKFSPWELPEKAFFGEGEWFFFSPRERKYPNGARPNRAAPCGYWKATGTDKPILTTVGSQCLGVKKALVFYKGRPPKGIKTDWVMHEYRLLDSTISVSHGHKGTMRLDDWVLCRVRQKGCFLPENDERAMSLLGKAQAVKERTIPFDFSNCGHSLDYMLGSAASASDSGGESSDLVQGSDHAGFQQQPELVTSMLSSIKRKLSFGAIDELMMLTQPAVKRPSFQFSAAGRVLSPTQSGSDVQGCFEFLM